MTLSHKERKLRQHILKLRHQLINFVKPVPVRLPMKVVPHVLHLVNARCQQLLLQLSRQLSLRVLLSYEVDHEHAIVILSDVLEVTLEDIVRQFQTSLH